MWKSLQFKKSIYAFVAFVSKRETCIPVCSLGRLCLSTSTFFFAPYWNFIILSRMCSSNFDDLCLLCLLIFLVLYWITGVSSMFKMYSTSSEAIEETHNLWLLLYSYPPKRRWIVVDMYRDAKRWGIYPPLFTDPEGDSCFSVYQIRWIKKRFFNFFFWNFSRNDAPFFSPFAKQWISKDISS